MVACEFILLPNIRPLKLYLCGIYIRCQTTNLNVLLSDKLFYCKKNSFLPTQTSFQLSLTNTGSYFDPWMIIFDKHNYLKQTCSC